MADDQFLTQLLEISNKALERSKEQEAREQEELARREAENNAAFRIVFCQLCRDAAEYGCTGFSVSDDAMINEKWRASRITADLCQTFPGFMRTSLPGRIVVAWGSGKVHPF